MSIENNKRCKTSCCLALYFQLLWHYQPCKKVLLVMIVSFKIATCTHNCVEIKILPKQNLIQIGLRREYFSVSEINDVKWTYIDFRWTLYLTKAISVMHHATQGAKPRKSCSIFWTFKWTFCSADM